MGETLFTVEQVADRLGLHVKTVRHYILQGRLQAVRIGKQYRISAESFAALTGQPLSTLNAETVARVRHAEISSVIEVDAVSPELTSRITNLLMGATNSRVQENGSTHLQTIYDPRTAKLKIILVAELATANSLLQTIQALVMEAR
jgi:excisionase family DNA binding protein